jgi:threonine/homoserine/homoserine lactone efflux protein
MMDAELPLHLLYMLVFGAVLLGAVVALVVETGTRDGKRRIGMIAWSVLAALVGAVFLVINIANVISESGNPGAG